LCLAAQLLHNLNRWQRESAIFLPEADVILHEPAMPIIDANARDRLTQYCRRHNIRRLSLFGSQARGNATPGSDIDLLVEFDEGEEPGLIGLAAMESELSSLLDGHKVDLRTPRDLSRHFRDEVLRNAQVQYAA
jgi:predicted nucleotidyltransferase